jgi:hypothetical protein
MEHLNTLDNTLDNHLGSSLDSPSSSSSFSHVSDQLQSIVPVRTTAAVVASSSFSSSFGGSQQNGKSNPGLAAVELVAGGMAGVVSWVTIIPFDVVKTRLQSQKPLPQLTAGSLRAMPGGSGAALQVSTQERRFWPTLRNIVSKEGFWRLYAGSSPLLVRAFCFNAVSFWGYEECLRFCKAAR